MSMRPLMTVLVVLATLAAGSLGAVLRAWVVATVQRRAGRASARAWGTAAVNLAGTAVMASVVVATREARLGPAVAIVVGVGFAGALTTFSGWVVDAVRLAGAGARSWPRAIGLELVGQLALGMAVASVIVAR
jgi:fluoride exporter